jgi:hypothetical protein
MTGHGSPATDNPLLAALRLLLQDGLELRLEHGTARIAPSRCGGGYAIHLNLSAFLHSPAVAPREPVLPPDPQAGREP